MATVKNVDRNQRPLELTGGRTLPFGQEASGVNVEAENEAAWIAAGSLLVTNGTAEPPAPFAPIIPVDGAAEEWDSQHYFPPFIITRYQGALYLALTGSVNQRPSTSPGTWLLLVAPGEGGGGEGGAGGVSKATVEGIVEAEQQRAEDAEALLAPLDSPVLTGTPQVPTPGLADNSERAVNAQWVNARLAEAATGGGSSQATTASQYISPNSFTYEGKQLGVTAAQAQPKNAFNAANGANAITLNNHGLVVNQPIVFPELRWGSGVPNLTAGQVYWIVSATTNTFAVSTVKGGTPITITGVLQGGKVVVDASILIELAALAAKAAFSLTGGTPGVAFTEPGAYWLESFRVSPNPKAYEKTIGKSVVKPTYTAAVHLPGGVSYFQPSAGHAVLKVGPSLISRQMAEREAHGEAFQCVILSAEPGGGEGLKIISGVTIECPDEAVKSVWLRSKTPPPYPDGIYSGSTGLYEEINVKGLRYRFVNGSNHKNVDRVRGVCWAQFANTNWGSWGAITGNDDYLRCTFSGGFCSYYLEPETSLTSCRIILGWGGFSTKGPLIYKPVTSARKKNFINSVHLFYHQLESGRGPLAYNEDRQGKIENFTITQIQAGGADPPFGAIPPSEIYLGYNPEAGIADAAIIGDIVAEKVSKVRVEGNGFAAVGFGPGAGLIVANQVQECELGDLTEALGKAIGRGIPLINTFGTSPAVIDVTGTYTNKDGTTAHIAFAYANHPVSAQELLRLAPAATSSAGPYGVQPFDKSGAELAGIALHNAPAETVVAYATRSAERKSTTMVSIAQLGFGEGSRGQVTPVVRGGKLQVPAVFPLGTGTGATHALPIATEAINPFRGSLFVTGFGDITSPSTVLSFGGQATPIFVRQLIAQGTTTTFKATLEQGSPVVKLVKHEVTGIAAGFKVTGAGIPANTTIQLVDGQNWQLELTAPATASGEHELTVVAPRNTFEGVLFGSSVRTTAPIELATMTGAGEIPVESTAGLASSGTVSLEVNPWSQKPFKTQVSYTSISGNTLKGCKANNTKPRTIPAQTVIAPLGTPKVGSHARIFRAVEVLQPQPPSSTLAPAASAEIEGTLTAGQLTLTGLSSTNILPGTLITGAGIPIATTVASVNAGAKTLTLSQRAEASGTKKLVLGTEMQFSSGGAGTLPLANAANFPEEGIALIRSQSVLSAAVTLTNGTTRIPVADASKFAKTLALQKNTIVGKLEVGGTTVNLTGVDLAHNELIIERGPTKARSYPAGTAVFLPVVEIAWKGKSANNLLEVKSLQGENFVTAGDPVERLTVSTEGGVIEGKTTTGEPVRVSYKLLVKARGKWFLGGLQTPGGGLELAASVPVTGTLTGGKTEVTGLSSTAGLTEGQLITGAGIPPNTTIASVNAGAKTLTLSQAAEAGGAGVPLLAGGELTDMTVLKVTGGGFPAGPAAVITGQGNSATTFTYTAALSGAGQEGLSEAEEEEATEIENEEEAPTEGESETAGLAESGEITYFAGVANVRVLQGTEGSSGFYSGGTLLNGTLANGATINSITVNSTAGFPSAGVIRLGKDKIPYTAIASGTVFTVPAYKLTEEHANGTPVVLSPGEQVAADTVLRAAFTEGERTGTGDIGVARAGGTGALVGTTLGADYGSRVPALI